MARLTSTSPGSHLSLCIFQRGVSSLTGPHDDHRPPGAFHLGIVWLDQQLALSRSVQGYSRFGAEKNAECVEEAFGENKYRVTELISGSLAFLQVVLGTGMNFKHDRKDEVVPTFCCVLRGHDLKGGLIAAETACVGGRELV